MRAGQGFRRSLRSGWRHRLRRAVRGQALLELMIAMSVFASALHLTMKAHLSQVMLMQQIDRHRMALRGLEARGAAEDAEHGARDRRPADRHRRAGHDAPDDAPDDAVRVALAGALTARLHLPEWTLTREDAGGNGRTVCWKEPQKAPRRARSNKDDEVKELPSEVQGERVDDVHCESLALP